jgi:hypothetical protein
LLYRLCRDRYLFFAKWVFLVFLPKNIHEPFHRVHYPKSQRCEMREESVIIGNRTKTRRQHFENSSSPSNFAFVFGGLGGYASL